MIAYFPSWCRWNWFRSKRNRRKGTTGLLAIAGATAMDSFVGQVWLGDGCEAASVDPLTLDLTSADNSAPPTSIAGGQPWTNAEASIRLLPDTAPSR